MRIEQLRGMGLPSALVESWNRHQGQTLLPLQVSAVDSGILTGQSLLIAAPTSSGKTFCGELALAAAVARRKKAVFLVPLKAIAEEKFLDFSQKYAPLGLKVVVSTKDRRAFDGPIERGQFDLAILIYEKFNQLLIRNLDLLSLIDLLVIDEIQMLDDPTRGPVLELALLKVLSFAKRPQIVALSAVLEDAAPLADWLGCRLLVERKRPVELFTGVLLESRFAFRAFNTKEEGEEQWEVESAAGEDKIDADQRARLVTQIQKCVAGGDPVLVFLKGKRDCQGLAQLLAEAAPWPPAAGALEEIEAEPEVVLSESLAYCLRRGVAFHHADLPFSLRRIVEHSFLAGEIKIVCATTTLALGVNLPAQTVFVEPWKYRNGPQTNRPVLVPLSVAEFENMAGRAGRLNLAPSGRAVLLAKTPLEQEVLWSNYVTGRREKIASRLSHLPLGDIVLDLVAAESVKTVEELEATLLKSFHWVQKTPDLSPTLSSKEREGFCSSLPLRGGQGGVSPKDIKRAIEDLAGRGLLTQHDNGSIAATSFGKKVAQTGIRVATGKAIEEACSSKTRFDALDWFYFLCGTEEAANLPVTLNFHERTSDYYHGLWLKEKTNFPPDSGPLVSGQMVVRLKLALLLSDWIDGVVTFDLEKKFFSPAGTIQQVAETLEWLLDAAAQMALVLCPGQKLSPELKSLSRRVKWGAREELLPFFDALGPAAGRDHLLKLVASGWKTIEGLKQATVEELRGVVPQKIAERIVAHLERPQAGAPAKEKSHPARAVPEQGGNQNPRKAGLWLVGVPKKQRWTVEIDGQPVLLSNKSFRFLALLAFARVERPDGWLSKEELEPGDYQARYLFQLKREIAEQLGVRKCRGESLDSPKNAGEPKGSPLHATGRERPNMIDIENDRRGHYRLALKPEEIDFDFATLAKHPDVEIKKGATRLSTYCPNKMNATQKE